jgi:hypothetical protein
MTYLALLRICCVPVIGIAVIAVLAEDQNFFRTLMILPLGIALPLLIWSTININGRIRTNHLIDNKYLVTFVFSWAVVAVAICFYFLLEAAMSHGAVPAELFRKNCLFAIIVIVVYPLIDIVLLRYSPKSEAKSSRKIRYSQIIVKGIVLVSAVSILGDIISPPLNAALRRNYSSTARALVYLGSDLNKTDRYKCTPLWYSLHKPDLNMTIFLVDKGAHLEKRFEGMALTRAVESNRIDMLRLLLSRGVDPNSTYMGATPLVHACLKRDFQMIEILLETGAGINIRSSFPGMPYDGKSAVDIAGENGDPQLTKLIIGNSVK